MRIDLSGKVALVTGGAAGIGAACSRALHGAGAQVVIAGRNRDAAARLAAELGQGALAARVEVTDPASCAALVDLAVETFGGLDIAVNNAGIANPPIAIVDTTIEDWRMVIATNLDGVFHCLKPEMAALRDGGAVVNLSSILGAVGQAGAAAYVASKHAVEGLTRVAALEGAARGIRVNAVAPGYVRTGMVQDPSPETMARIAALHPLGRMGTPEEIAAAVLFLASPAAGFVTGACYAVDGGYLAQ